MAERLADFIGHNIEPIVAQWEAFARIQLPAAAKMGTLTLRDHAEEILQAIAKDLREPQSREQQSQKSKGLAPMVGNAPETAAQTHALLRAHSGFDVRQLAAEYRALRASVLRLWMDDCGANVPHLDDVIRFNEAIDQALAESLDFFTVRVEQSRNLFLGMLGHDLRSPLQSIQMTATYLGALNVGEEISAAAKRLIGSGARMHALLDDLLDFNRAQLGLGISVTPTPVDLASLCADEVNELCSAYPGQTIELQVTGDVRGTWDGRRLRQLLSNLVINAVKYGDPGTPVHVRLIGEGNPIRIEVSNTGEAIDSDVLESLFEPLRRGVHDGSDRSSLGLGLYIAREISKAHGGDVEAHSDHGETVFRVRLPRLLTLPEGQE
ncbi:sensor histidine kinase [Propionivibrio soli]|uniref:sensor histidine kinase n=1 Tax=Propionivibrio soli TaxID=2976531 RepID=UPI0021E7551F|nr:sensor histidine kinase [Propionivibrio soli]